MLNLFAEFFYLGVMGDNELTSGHMLLAYTKTWSGVMEWSGAVEWSGFFGAVFFGVNSSHLRSETTDLSVTPAATLNELS